MAGPRTQCNLPPTDKNELAGRALFEGSSTSTPISTTSRAPTPTLAPTSALGLPGRYTDENLQRAIKFASELFVQGQKYGQFEANFAPCNRPLNARNPDLSYRHLHIECYYFYQQYKNHFDMAGTMGFKCVLFAAFFLHNRVNFQWQ